MKGAGQGQRSQGPRGSDHGILGGVQVFQIGLSDQDAATLSAIVPAFGGSLAESMHRATHVVVPDKCPTATMEGLRPILEDMLRLELHVVEFRWLQATVSGDGDPCDQQVLFEHTPPFVQSMICEVVDKGGAFPKRRRRKKSAPDSDSSRPTSSGPLAWEEHGQRTSKAAPLAGNVALASSLQETWEFLRKERPQDLEEGELQLAIHRSLLDSALQLHSSAHGGARARPAAAAERPEKVLGVRKDASLAEVKAAYREKALAAHPDKGGNSRDFCRIQRAFLALSKGAPAAQKDSQCPAMIEASADKDLELRDHKALVRAKFEEDGVDLDECAARQVQALGALGLKVEDVGATNTNEKGDTMYNQCFYLSLARSFLAGATVRKQDVQDTGLLMKRVIEAAVLATHPDWAGSRVGEDVQAFSDFLFFVLGSHTLLSEFSVAVFDSVSGGVELYKGRAFPTPDREQEQRSNFLTVYYVPGHYQALVPAERSRPTPHELEKLLEAHGVRYVTTNV